MQSRYSPSDLRSLPREAVQELGGRDAATEQVDVGEALVGERPLLRDLVGEPPLVVEAREPAARDAHELADEVVDAAAKRS
ncbi:hypothetical protein SAMN02745121_05906 [Nannocystis exedens]|uniref:Uncharacterized protein n=1 Tax=Nannocystis exedens TaxID=54 RepID=A0A1I2E3C7_9BACT|nr:hypothetical protein [Nannocystis exedens]PCC69263.1 hypothetical protein NAEX_02285 [Nannocystis exedens]SFE87462.1 hypothetical protein SAMN02745121_05906 [Nannocystis exedens]